MMGGFGLHSVFLRAQIDHARKVAGLSVKDFIGPTRRLTKLRGKSLVGTVDHFMDHGHMTFLRHVHGAYNGCLNVLLDHVCVLNHITIMTRIMVVHCVVQYVDWRSHSSFSQGQLSPPYSNSRRAHVLSLIHISEPTRL